MSRTPATIPVPASAGTGASVSVSQFDSKGRTFAWEPSSSSDAGFLEGSNDNTNFQPIGQLFNNTQKNITIDDGNLYYRFIRTAGTGAASLKVSGGPASADPGPAGPPAFGDAAFSGGTTTADATPAVAAIYGTPDDGTFTVTSQITGQNTTDGQSVSYMLVAVFLRAAGVVTQIGTTQRVRPDIESAGSAAADGDITFSGADLHTMVTGIAGKDFTWTVDGTVQSVLV